MANLSLSPRQTIPPNPITNGSRSRPSTYTPNLSLGLAMVIVMAIFNIFYQSGSTASDLSMFLRSSSQQERALISVLEEKDALVVVFPFEKPRPRSAAVFYHVYLPPTPEGRENSARIIQEQLQQLQASKQSLTIYYNTIGGETPQLNRNHIQQLCQDHGQICHHMEHFESGMEDKTLQRLHDFCHLAEEDYSIVYLHNKGSFSTKPLNEAWRYQMTQSVVSEQCRAATTNNQCNLCGLWFSAERGMFMAGNMWRTKCSYAKQLIAPRRFQAAMHQVTAEAMMERLRYKLLITLQEPRAGVFGIDRYATEFWVASHPSVRPCDFSKVVPVLLKGKYDITDRFLGWLRKMGDDYQSPLEAAWFAEKAPSHPLPLSAEFQVSKYRDVRRREYFLLAGNLYRWYFLYNQAPPGNSWVYRWFPDGDMWRDAVAKHGNRSVERVTAAALKEEIASGRNRYTADNSKKLTPTTTTTKSLLNGIKAAASAPMATKRTGAKELKNRG